MTPLTEQAALYAAERALMCDNEPLTARLGSTWGLGVVPKRDSATVL